MGQDPDIVVGLINKRHVPRPVEQFPPGMRNSIIHGLGYQRRAFVVGSADNKRRLRDLMQTGGIVKVLECSRRCIFVGAPCLYIRLEPKPFLSP